jgi:hypothetical protein
MIPGAKNAGFIIYLAIPFDYNRLCDEAGEE